MVSLCSNAVGIHPQTQTTRFSRQTRQRIQVEQPAIVKFYNKSMGGVDRINENISKYRVAIRGKKWYSSIVSYLIDVFMNNAWLLHRRNKDAEKLDLLAFRRRVVSYYLEHYARQPGCKGRPSAIETELQFDKVNHGSFLKTSRRAVRTVTRRLQPGVKSVIKNYTSSASKTSTKSRCVVEFFCCKA